MALRNRLRYTLKEMEFKTQRNRLRYTLKETEFTTQCNRLRCTFEKRNARRNAIACVIHLRNGIHDAMQSRVLHT